MKTRLVLTLLLLLGSSAQAGSLAEKSIPPRALAVSENHRCLVEAATGKPVFLLADTAWNLAALKAEEVDIYLDSRASHGFNVIMFALNFAPQADEKNAYGQSAYIGEKKTELNPEYFTYCDAIIEKCARRGMYAMPYAMWAGKKSGTMNNYTEAELQQIGEALGKHFKGKSNVILCAGGEATPHYIETELVGALGSGLKTGCEGKNLVTLHPVSGNSTSKFFADAPWLDFYMSQAKSGSKAESVTYDAAKLVLGDYSISSIKPTMMAEHRYEVGTEEDPLIQRRSLYQCVFAGGCGYAYGHNALWQMTPHTAQPWMLKGWSPGVQNWSEALNTKAVQQLKHIKALLASRPFLSRIPDQSLVLSGQGESVAARVQAMRDEGTYLMAYLSAPTSVELNVSAIKSPTLNVYWYDPATGSTEVIGKEVKNIGTYRLEKRQGDGVLIIDDARRGYSPP